MTTPAKLVKPPMKNFIKRCEFFTLGQTSQDCTFKAKRNKADTVFLVPSPVKNKLEAKRSAIAKKKANFLRKGMKNLSTAITSNKIKRKNKTVNKSKAQLVFRDNSELSNAELEKQMQQNFKENTSDESEVVDPPRNSKKQMPIKKEFVAIAVVTLRIVASTKNGFNALAVDALLALFKQRHCYLLDADNGRTHCVAPLVKHLSGSVLPAPSYE